MRKTPLYNEVVRIETAVLAKTADFDTDCKEIALYYCEFEGQIVLSPNPCPKLCKIICMAPTQSLLQRWLREEKGLHITVPFDNNEFWWQIKNLANGNSEYGEALGFGTYELALEDALKYALGNLV